MARICEISGKHTQTGNNVSHANNKTKRKFYPNLQTKKIFLPEHGVWLSLRVSTSVLRTMRKKGALSVLKEAHKKGTLAPYLRPLVKQL
ncbi:MAG: 50S ribosomal protein L28 [Bacteroidota bacterium]